MNAPLGPRQQEALLLIGQSTDAVFSRHIAVNTYRTVSVRQSVLDALCRRGLIDKHEYLYRLYRVSSAGRAYLASRARALRGER